MADSAPNAEWVQGFDADAVHGEVKSWFEADAARAALELGDSEIERIALEWLACSGKRWRPFLAVCTHAALQEVKSEEISAGVRRLAIALECIHKASLIYDDIQDGDEQRYGQPTVHAVHGVPVAMTAALLLLGHGYRLVAASSGSPEQANEMVTLATMGHCQLCLGQGSELLWMRRPKPLTSQEVLGIFRWKTAPSFEVVFRLPAVCAGASSDVHEVLRKYSIGIGTAYQIQDDLDDYHGRGDVDDVGSRRPSIVLAFAYEHADEAGKKAIADAWMQGGAANRALAGEVIAQVGADKLAREALGKLKRTALDDLRPLKSLGLKLLLSRITEKVLPGV